LASVAAQAALPAGAVLGAENVGLAELHRALGPMCEIASAAPEAFRASLRVWANRRVALSRLAAPGFERLRSARTIRRTPLPVAALRVSSAPATLEDGDGAALRLDADDVFVVDLGRPLRLQVEEPCRETWVWFASARLPALAAVRPSLGACRFERASPSGAFLRAALESFGESVDAASAAEFDLLGDALVEAAARLFEPRAGAAAPPPLETLASVQRYIESQLAVAALGPDMIARNFGLSRASVFRLFRPVGGVATYIRKRRLERAFAEITAPSRADRRVGSIAFSLGFANQSAFSRLFQSEYGVTPLQARRTVSAPAPKPARAGGGYASLSDILADLRPHHPAATSGR
jgi:AraC-like DNA-binding protein